MFLNELLCLWANMNFVIVPDQNDLTSNQVQQLFQKGNRMTGTQMTWIRAHGQSQAAPAWADQQCAQQVQALMMVQTGAGGGCSPAR